MKFELGRLLASAGAMKVLREDEMLMALSLHAAGEWGEVCEDDKQANQDALRDGTTRILSAYTFRQARVWVLTEADRSATTILLPEEY
jgi:hypothetical protein